MTDGHMEGGKFHPHKNNGDAGVTSDQVENKEPEQQMDSSKAEELKKQKS